MARPLRRGGGKGRATKEFFFKGLSGRDTKKRTFFSGFPYISLIFISKQLYSTTSSLLNSD